MKQTKNNAPIPDAPECVRNHLGVYACEPATFRELHAALVAGRLPACSAAELEERRAAPASFEVTADGIAVIPVRGVMQRGDSKFNDVANTLKIRKQFREAAGRDDVRGVMLHIDSPGGAVAGQTELVDELDRLAAAKPVRAAVDEMACSAAYWLASRTGYITANRLAQVANIGCYTVAYDETGALERRGIRIIVVSTGKYKGLGADGSVPPELVEEMQIRVEAVNAEFVRAVAEGRGLPLETVEALADGKAYSGDAALERGFVDAIGNFDEAMNDFVTQLNRERETKMAEEKKLIGEFQALADRDGYEFAKEHFGKSEAEIEIARRDVKISKLETAFAALQGERDSLSQELEKEKARVAELEKENAALKEPRARGAVPAGFQAASAEKKKPMFNSSKEGRN